MRDASEDFANAVVTFKTTRSPQQLLTQLRAMERDAGRPWQHGPNEARILDLDIIAYGDLMVNQENLSIPHPRAHQRQFVMVPLQEICPDFRFPGMDQSLPALVNQAPVLRLEKWC
jgi:2-amino-4-hydroxy-6-hydroxymethyldihydropteridine diphosphokinase